MFDPASTLKRDSIMKRILAAGLLSCVFAVPSFAGADLVADFDTATGTVKVTNIGDSFASISVVTVECKRRSPPVVGRGGGCPDPAPAAAAPYMMPAFPNKVAIAVKPLKPGEIFTHAIAFFPGLVFPSGRYSFTIVADAGFSVGESNEGNNVVVRLKNVP